MFGCDVYINFNWFPRNHTLVDIKLHNFLVWSNYDLCYFPASLRNIQGKKLFFIPLVHWTSKTQILVVRKLISLVQKNVLKQITKYH